MVEDDPLESDKRSAKTLGVLTGTLAAWRCQGRGPRYVKVGRKVYYRRSALTEWLRAQERDPAVKS